jgi:ABC-type Fe3+ transport system permease subunit
VIQVVAIRLPFVQSFSFDQTALTSHPATATLLLAAAYLALVFGYRSYSTSIEHSRTANRNDKVPSENTRSSWMARFLRIWNLSLCVASLVMLVGMVIPKVQHGYKSIITVAKH